MRDEIANLVHRVLGYGLRLMARLQAGEPLDLQTEQLAIKGYLLSELEAKRWPEYGGEGPAAVSGVSEEVDSDASSRDRFLGIRYALVCWLDELFTVDSPWSTAWNERKLEAALYGTNDRAWRFWEQARLAEVRPGSDALEAFYLCVALGFRGELREMPTRLQAWAAAARHRILAGPKQEWSSPPELDPVTNVPPLHGREMLQRMVIAGGIFVLILIPIVASVVVAQLR